MPPYIARMPRRRSVLLVAQLTPPGQSSGARRPANLAKYLDRRGHRVTVLTSLASGRGGVPGAALVVRTRDVLSSRLNWRRSHFESLQGRVQATAVPSSLLESIVVPDLSLPGWLPFALPRALSLARTRRFDCVVTTSPPQSAHLIGLALRRAGIPWVADLRDGWTFDPPRPPWPTRVQEAVDRALERSALSRADRLVAVTPPIAGDLARRLGREVAVITNGFDPDEAAGDGVAAAEELLSANRHSLVHTGRAAGSGRTPQPLIEGLAELRRTSPETAERLEVVFAGPTTEEERAMLADERVAGLVRSVGMLERPRALALQRAADSLLVIAEGDSVTSVATNKLYEYLAAGRPVLVLGDGSEAARIVREAGSGIVTPAGDPAAVADALRRLEEGSLRGAPTGIERFSWPLLAERFEREIEAACAPAAGA
jgi:glycosyltransferase involved in cell wall biosynthesis